MLASAQVASRSDKATGCRMVFVFLRDTRFYDFSTGSCTRIQVRRLERLADRRRSSCQRIDTVVLFRALTSKACKCCWRAGLRTASTRVCVRKSLLIAETESLYARDGTTASRRVV